jgi:ABC-type transport system substrate-binding protein
VKPLCACLAVLALASGLASAAPEAPALKKGGIFLVGTTGASVSIDPQVAYVSTTWWLEYATAAKLYNYPDKRGQAGGVLRPEVASRYAVSRDGKTYTFTIRKGFRFSDGTRVTARNFECAIRRARDPQLRSPAADFIADVTSVRARGDGLTIRLAKPDPALLSTLAMPFFQATSTKLPLTREVTTGYPSAGPYYFSRHDANSLTSIRKNPYWHGNRPRHLDGLEIRWNLNEQTAYEQTLANKLDEGPIPAFARQDVVNRFGINKTRLWLQPIACESLILFNNASGLFAGNPAMRKAVNWALDRTDYVGGNFTVTPWTHLLSPLTPGSVTARRKQPYGPHSNIEKARALAAGHFRDGKIVVAYRSSGTVNPTQAQIVRRDLIRLGFKPEDITMKVYVGGQIYDTIASGAQYDMGISMGWCSDYPADAYSELKGYLTLAKFDDAAINAKLAAAARLPRKERAKRLGKLDLEIMRTVAPLAPMGYYNKLSLFSNRVDPRSLVYQPVYADWSIPALALK